jgi:hypothetical protein
MCVDRSKNVAPLSRACMYTPHHSCVSPFFWPWLVKQPLKVGKNKWGILIERKLLYLKFIATPVLDCLAVIQTGRGDSRGYKSMEHETRFDRVWICRYISLFQLHKTNVTKMPQKILLSYSNICSFVINGRNKEVSFQKWVLFKCLIRTYAGVGIHWGYTGKFRMLFSFLKFMFCIFLPRSYRYWL